MRTTLKMGLLNQSNSIIYVAMKTYFGGKGGLRYGRGMFMNALVCHHTHDILRFRLSSLVVLHFHLKIKWSARLYVDLGSHSARRLHANGKCGTRCYLRNKLNNLG